MRTSSTLTWPDLPGVAQVFYIDRPKLLAIASGFENAAIRLRRGGPRGAHLRAEAETLVGVGGASLADGSSVYVERGAPLRATDPVSAVSPKMARSGENGQLDRASSLAPAAPGPAVPAATGGHRRKRSNA